MSMVRRERRPQSGHTNRRQQEVGKGSILSNSRSSASLIRPKSASLAMQRAKSATILQPLPKGKRRLHLKDLSVKDTLALSLNRGVQENVVIEALIQSISENLQQRYTGKRSLRHVFLAWDANRDGVVDPGELEAIFHKCGCNISNQQAREICRYFGTDDSEYIPYEGFLDLIFKDEEVWEGRTMKSNVEDLKNRLRSLGLTDEEIMRTATKHLHDLPVSEVIKRLKQKFQAKGSLQREFRLMDEDKNGCVSLDEMHAFLKRIGLETSKEELNQLFSTFDRSSDGGVQYEEFVKTVFPPSDVGAFHRLTPRDDTDLGMERPETETEREVPHTEVQSKRKSREIHTKDLSANVKNGIRNAVLVARIRKNVSERLAREFSSVNAAFEAIDTNGDGMISHSEFRSALMGLNLGLKPAELDIFLRYTDQDGNGFVNYDEFRQNIDTREDSSAWAFTSTNNNFKHAWEEKKFGPESSSRNNRRDVAPGGDRSHFTKTASVSNIGFAQSNKIPNFVETHRIQTKRKLFQSKQVSGPSRSSTEGRQEDLSSAKITREKKGLRKVVRFEDDQGRSTNEPRPLSRKALDLRLLHEKDAVIRQKRPVHDTTYLIRPTPEEKLEGVYSYSGGEQARFLTESRSAFNLTANASYHRSKEQVDKRLKYQNRLESNRMQQNRWKREEIRPSEDPDRHLKSILKQRLNYYSRLDGQLEREARRQGISI